MSGRRVLLDEMTGSDELGPVALAVFRGSLFSGTDQALEQVTDLPLDAALAWGCERASIVEVRLAGFDAGVFSAGSEATSAPPLDRAPKIVRRRPAGWEFLDRTEEDDPIMWDVVIEVDRPTTELLASHDNGDTWVVWRELIDATPGCQVRQIRERPSAPPAPPAGTGAWTAYAHEPLAVVQVQGANRPSRHGGRCCRCALRVSST